jgi:hypothetical protein
MSRILSARIDGADVQLETEERPLWWHDAGLQYTASGYGSRIPTAWVVRLPGSKRWRRVYCCIYGNSGTCYVGRSIREGVIITD